MPDIENSRKTAEKGADWVTVKQPVTSRKNSWNTGKIAVLTVSAAFVAVFRPFAGTLPLAGLETQTQNAAFFERKRPKRKPWPRGKSLNRANNDRNAFLER